jgi:hypothetical protein
VYFLSFCKGLLISTPTPNANGRELKSKFIKIAKVKSTLSGKMVADGKPEGSVPLLVIQHEDGDREVDVEEEGGGTYREGKGEDKVVIGSLEIISYFEFIVSSSPSPSLDLPSPTLTSIGSMSAFESCMGRGLGVSVVTEVIKNL